MWQDYVIAVVLIAFMLTIIPMITSRVRLPLLTTLPMTLGAMALALVYLTLNLWFAFSVEVASVLLWTILLVRTFKHGV